MPEFDKSPEKIIKEKKDSPAWDWSSVPPDHGETDRKTGSFYSVLNCLDAIVFVVDMQSKKVLYSNKLTTNLLGDVIGKNCWEVLGPETSEPCSSCTSRCSHDAYEKRQELAGHEIRNALTGKWYDVREREVKLPDGKIGRVHLASDITEKKRVDLELRKSEEKYRTVADYTYDWECWVNEERQFEYVSPSCERITGYSVDEFLNDPDLLYNIIHPDDKPSFIHHRKSYFTSGQSAHLDFRIITRTGSERWMSHYCQPVYSSDGSFRGRRSSNRDITDRKIAEHKTKLDEQRLSMLLQLYEKKELPIKVICDFVLESSLPLTSSSIGFMGFLKDNESIMTIHTWSKTVMRECTMHEKPIEYPVAGSGVWGEAVRQRQPVIINDFYAPSSFKKGTPEGHVTIKRFMAVPFIFENRVVAVLAVGNKPSDYIKEDVAQVGLLLEGMWQIMLRKKAEDELVRQSEKVKRFANAVAHDLKSPAITVHGFARMLKDKFKDVLGEKGLKYCDQIMKSSEQISSLAEDINIYISTRENACEFEQLELPKLWDAIRQEFYLQLKERNIQMRETDVAPVAFKCNKMGVLRIFRNLVDNALKYGGEGLSEIVLGYELSKDYHILSVANNGDAILPDDEKIIFEEFARTIRKPKVYGTGLGLAIVRQIANKHQGNSWLTTSETGEPVFCISISRNL